MIILPARRTITTSYTQHPFRKTTNKRRKVMESIKQILIRRDSMSESEADELIQDARDTFNEYLANGDMSSAEDVCNEFFGLEPDYLDELI
jgi:predicted DNA-binding protein (UPF0278 family)